MNRRSFLTPPQPALGRHALSHGFDASLQKLWIESRLVETISGQSGRFFARVEEAQPYD
jgi:hypothetical protein